MIGNSLHRFHPTGFMLLDTETESLNLRYSRPWQIAWGVCDTKGHFSSIKTRYIWFDDLHVSDDAARITRFDYNVYKAGARPAREVYEEFKVDRDNPEYKVVWQNGLHFDCYVIATLERALGIEPVWPGYLLRSIDTNALIKAQQKGWLPDVSSPEAFLAWQYRAVEWHEKGLKSNLTHAAKARGIEHDYSTTHDAESDIRLMGKVWAKVLYELEF